MSQYTNFFLKGEDKFYSLGDFSRSSAIAQIANSFLGNRYNVAHLVTQEMIDGCRYETQNKIAELNIYKDKIKERLDFIRTCADNSLDEKYQYFIDYEAQISDTNDEIENFKQALNFFDFLAWIESPVYAGIECGEQPGEVLD